LEGVKILVWNVFVGFVVG